MLKVFRMMIRKEAGQLENRSRQRARGSGQEYCRLTNQADSEAEEM